MSTIYPCPRPKAPRVKQEIYLTMHLEKGRMPAFLVESVNVDNPRIPDTRDDVLRHMLDVYTEVRGNTHLFWVAQQIVEILSKTNDETMASVKPFAPKAGLVTSMRILMTE